MPVKSGKQFRFMEAAKSGKVKGIDPEVAKEFLRKTPHKKKSAFARMKRNG